MKKNFSIKSTGKKIQIASAKRESSNLLNFLTASECCAWNVAITGNAATQKSFILG